MIVTDQQQMLDLMKYNISLNQAKAKAEVLNWGEDVSKFNPPFDIVIACDVMANCYNEVYDKLIQTLQGMFINYMAHKR